MGRVMAYLETSEPSTVGAIAACTGMCPSAVIKRLWPYRHRGWAEEIDGGIWRPTPKYFALRDKVMEICRGVDGTSVNRVAWLTGETGKTAYALLTHLVDVGKLRYDASERRYYPV